jgi:hypothetical protein
MQYRLLVGIPKGKRVFGRHWLRWCLEEVGVKFAT